MNEQKKKDSILKSLAIAGFIGIIILIAWLSIQLVHVIPGAFASLASLAESVSKQQELSAETTRDTVPLQVTSNTSLTNAGEPITISWGEASVPGTFTFSYTCAEGVAVDLINVEGLRGIDCDRNYNIGNVTSLTISVDSEKERYMDLTYTIAFLGTNDTVPRASGSAIVTIINSDIQNILVSAPEEVTEPEWTEPVVTTPEPEVSTSVPVTPVPTPTPVPTTPAPTPVPTPTPAPTTPTYEQEYVYTIPTSDPNGRTDLAARFLNTGTIVGNTFFVGAISQDEAGAIQFEVKNVGTKTSEDWTFTVTLPNGNNYESSTQKPLKPNERAVLTIGFPAPNTASHNFTVVADDTTDSNTLNDRFVQTVTFVR